ncbi:hypothetical protein [Sphingobacterium sp. UDSM-2020]|uniref:hypothetical protein n=1 Tax=Sphingobacterium sp. UDSM-2020 TaxID=2795738 RepID=UPI0019350251|nr:hypothetical protein [Sphingobacterium sp. UDSM-2020]QQD12977.1 hypothetical protein JAZ75_20610 [Sphingobacterium sp. UDSM-2020]
MNKEIQDYIITYYLDLMSPEEKLAYKHAHSTLKLDGSENLEKMQRIYLKTGWLTKDQTVLSLLNNGLEKFNENTATRILRDHHLDIVFNYCPKCHKLARTPTAKQCRFCFHDWHKENNNITNCDL